MYSVIAGLNKTKSRKWMGRYIVTFLLYYDAGQAARIANDLPDAEFWGHLIGMEKAPPELRLRRGTERRHFRGENARKALEKLASFGLEPWELLMEMYSPTPVFPAIGIPYTEFYNRMSTKFAGTQFGPYFIWKLYDIFNVCLDMPISLSYDEAVKYMPDEPKKAAAHFFPDMGFLTAVRTVNEHIMQFDHPVMPGRKCGLAEAETVLCMMKGAFLTKSHTIGDDIEEKFQQLRGYPLLQRLLPDSLDARYQLGDLVV